MEMAIVSLLSAATSLLAATAATGLLQEAAPIITPALDAAGKVVYGVSFLFAL